MRGFLEPHNDNDRISGLGQDQQLFERDEQLVKLERHMFSFEKSSKTHWGSSKMLQRANICISAITWMSMIKC
jgi:hypothetical protein